MTNDWTAEEESAYKQIMQAGNLARLPAIRLYRRCGCDTVKALRIAKQDHGATDRQVAARTAGLVKAHAVLAANRATKQQQRAEPLFSAQ